MCYYGDMKKLTKKDRQAWWRSLTAEQQTDYRYNLMLSKKGVANWDKEYSQVLKENNYLK